MKTEITQPNKTSNFSLYVLALAIFIGAFADFSNALTDVLKIKIGGNGYSDETAIRFSANSTTEFDECCDAWKLFPTINNVPSIFTKTSGGDALAINSLPSLSTTYTTGLFLKIGQNNNYEITATELGAFAPGVCIILFDQATGYFYNLRDTTTLKVFNLPVTSKNDPARFIITFSIPATVTTANATCPKCDNGNVIIKKAGWANWNYSIVDSAQNIITSGISPNESVAIEQLAPGKYAVIVQAQSFTCTDDIPFNINTGGNGLGTNNISFSSQCKFSYYDGSLRIETNFNEPKNFTAQIINMEGKVIWKKDYTNTKELNNTIEIGDQISGIYSGVIQSNDFSSVKKIILTH